MDKKAFGERLTKNRKEKGLSRQELADAAGIALTTLGPYERGEKLPQLDVASKLAASLGVSIDSLAGFDNEGKTLQSWGDAIRMIGILLSDIPFIEFDKIVHDEDSEAPQLDTQYIIKLPYVNLRDKVPHPGNDFPISAGEIFSQLLPLLQNGQLSREVFLSVVDDCAKKNETWLLHISNKEG